jgi:Ni,Fe-hydrogenase I small subunit
MLLRLGIPDVLPIDRAPRPMAQYVNFTRRLCSERSGIQFKQRVQRFARELLQKGMLIAIGLVNPGQPVRQ